MGMGTVSWRRGSMCLMASIFLHFTNLPLLSSSLFENHFFFFSYFLLPLDVQLEGLIALSEVGVKHSSLGMSSSFAHSVTHSPSCCIKRGCTVTKTDLEIPLPPVAYAPPLSKTQRPIFRTLSDKHDLLVDPSLLRRMPTGRWVVEYLGSWQVCGCRINNLKDLDHAQ